MPDTELAQAAAGQADVGVPAESESAFRSLFDSAALGMAEVDNATGCFLRANAALGQILGYSPVELLQKTWMELTHPDDLAGDVAIVKSAPRGALRRSWEKRYLHKDGAQVWCAVTVAPILREGAAGRTSITLTQDIGQRIAAEQHSRESQEQLATILRMTTAGHIVLRQRDRVILDANEAWSRMLGWTRSEAVGRTAQDLGLLPSGDEHREARQKPSRGESGDPQVVRLRRRSGEIGEFVYSAVPAVIGGEPVLVGVLGDVTELRRADLLRRDSEERYATLFNLSPGGVVVTDERGRMVTFNERACAQLGYTRDEFAALTIQQIDAVDHSGDFEARVAELKAGKTIEFETLHRTKSGANRNVEVWARSVLLDGAEQILSIWHDVTERRQAEEEVRRSEARFRALIERSSDMTILLAADGRITFWSPSAAADLGVTAEEARGRELIELLHEADRPEVASGLTRLRFSPEAAISVKARALRKSGGWRFVEGLCRNLLSDAAVGALVLNLRDVTEERKLEQQLRQSQKLESIGRLAGGVAHDFNNLLTVVLSCAEQLENDLARTGTVALDDVREVRDAGLRASDLTRQLLAFARKQTLAPVPLSLDAMVAGSEKLLRRVLGEDVRLEVRPGAEPWTIFADKGQIDQVLLNLAVNARDAMPGGGMLSLETRRETRPSGDGAPGIPTEWVCLRVADTGIGMSPEVQARIFEPFFTTKGLGKGTGLGLATVHGIVAQCGGAIRVDSAPGQGTAFELAFPRNLVASLPAQLAVTPAGLRGVETLLLIEDDPRVRAVTAQALQRAGYRVLVAESGEQGLALAAAHEGPLDLVISDVVMPGMSGRDAVDALQRRSPALRALFVSGYTHDATAERGVPDSGPHFLAKPFTPNLLLARVREVLG